ncbi:hypothetical protein [Bordetella genomosp. 7]|uniref:hypothetical protein n=1 Tax=Bordetella genomosp. 7 TaxID=1416805 RepID=UPI00113FC934|nr:hypothetical protein [Bordetella genomosp. 7]
MRDTETYFSVILDGKSNRWLLRFWGDKRRPSIQFIEPITDAHQLEAQRAGLELGRNGQILLKKPEDLYRLAEIVRDAAASERDLFDVWRRAYKRLGIWSASVPPCIGDRSWYVVWNFVFMGGRRTRAAADVC